MSNVVFRVEDFGGSQLGHLKGKDNERAMRAFVDAFELLRPGHWRTTDGRVLRALDHIQSILSELVSQASPEEIVNVLLELSGDLYDATNQPPED